MIVDIDGTLLSQRLRRNKILQELFQIEIDHDAPDVDMLLERLYQKLINRKTVPEHCGSLEDIKDLFYQTLFGNKYYEPWFFSEIEDSSLVLTGFSRHVDIYYLSARNKSLYEATLWQLKEFNFPDVGLRSKLIILDHDFPPEEYKHFRRLSFEFKKKSVRRICGERHVMAGVGDIIEDVCAFNANGVPGILYTNNLTEKDVKEKYGKHSLPYDPKMVIMLSSWNEIRQYITDLLKNYTKDGFEANGPPVIP